MLVCSKDSSPQLYPGFLSLHQLSGQIQVPVEHSRSGREVADVTLGGLNFNVPPSSLILNALEAEIPAGITTPRTHSRLPGEPQRQLHVCVQWGSSPLIEKESGVIGRAGTLWDILDGLHYVKWIEIASQGIFRKEEWCVVLPTRDRSPRRGLRWNN